MVLNHEMLTKSTVTVLDPRFLGLFVEILGPFHYLGFKVLEDARILHECYNARPAEAARCARTTL